MKTELEIGQEFEGGIYVGTLNNHAIIMAPKETIKELNWYDAMEYYNNLEINGFYDWYLPNKEELNLIYENKLITKGWFWSSMETSSTSSWSQDFNSGNQFQGNKDYSGYCTAVRKVPLGNLEQNNINKDIKEVISYEYNNNVYKTQEEAMLIKELDILCEKYSDIIDTVLKKYKENR